MTVTNTDMERIPAPATRLTPRVEGGFPARRMRRLRRSESLRKLTRETALDPADFIFPLFVSDVISEPVAISSMPGQYQWPVSAMAARAEELAQLGIGATILFGVPEHKDEIGSSAWDARGPVQRAIREMKAAAPE